VTPGKRDEREESAAMVHIVSAFDEELVQV